VWGWLSRRVPESWFFGLPYGTIPSYTGAQFYEAHTRFAAGFPWRSRLHTMNALDTHDTARFRTSALEGAVPVAFGMSVTLPGIPVVFAGDEFGLEGVDGEHSRTPIPWDALANAEPLATETVALYSELIALRRAHIALNNGGIRWLHVGDDVLAYVREHESESVLVVAARADFAFSLEADAVAGEATTLYGSARLSTDAGGWAVTGTGPSFTVWQLPGIRIA
jgi:alpha-glucosidase